jgi:hypothetical protein
VAPGATGNPAGTVGTADAVALAAGEGGRLAAAGALPSSPGEGASERGAEGAVSQAASTRTANSMTAAG